jgi:ribosomal protein S20
VPNQNGGRFAFEKGFGKGYNNQDLATALGISVDQLNTAIQKANSDAIDQAVAKGLITQAQADQLKANGAAFPLGGRWEGLLSQNGIDYNSLLANALGISVDQLQAAYQKAYDTRIDQAVTNGNLTQQQADLLKGKYALFNNKTFQSAMQSAFQAAVKQAVTDGVITQAQADQILSSQNSMGFPGLGGFGGRGGFEGFEGFGGFGRHHGGFFGGGNSTNPTVPNIPTTPSTTPAPGSNGL